MSRLIDEYTRNKSPEDKKEVERRVREMAGTMSELSALMLVLEEMRQEGKADGGRIGYQEGTKPKISIIPQMDDKGNIVPFFSKSGKDQIEGAPEGITKEKQVFNLIVGLDLPITDKIGLLGELGFIDARDRYEKDDQELGLATFKDTRKKIGLRYGNEGDQGITGSIMLDPDTKDYMAGIKFFKKFAKGGRIGFKGGADMGTVSTPTRAATAKSVSISPTGGVTTSRDKGPDPVDDTGSAEQNFTQYLVNQGMSPREIRRITGKPSIIDKIRKSPINNPFTRGVLRTGLYTLNPSLGAVDFRKAMQLKNLYDYTKDQINEPVTEEDLTLGLITDKQKQIIDKQGKIGQLTGAFDPDQTFKAAKTFDDKGGFFSDAEPMTREEFDAYVEEKGFSKGGRIGLAEGTKKFMFNDVLREPMSELEKMSVGNPGTKEMYASEIREMLAQNRDEAKVKIPKKKKKQKPLKIDLEKIKKLIQKAKAREGAADGGIGYLLGE